MLGSSIASGSYLPVLTSLSHSKFQSEGRSDESQREKHAWEDGLP